MNEAGLSRVGRWLVFCGVRYGWDEVAFFGIVLTEQETVAPPGELMALVRCASAAACSDADAALGRGGGASGLLPPSKRRSASCGYSAASVWAIDR